MRGEGLEDLEGSALNLLPREFLPWNPIVQEHTLLRKHESNI